jgi:hypothetical protein
LRRELIGLSGAGRVYIPLLFRLVANECSQLGGKLRLSRRNRALLNARLGLTWVKGEVPDVVGSSLLDARAGSLMGLSVEKSGEEMDAKCAVSNEKNVQRAVSIVLAVNCSL